MRCNTPCPLFSRKGKDCIHGTARLESANLLEILRLEEEHATGNSDIKSSSPPRAAQAPPRLRRRWRSGRGAGGGLARRELRHALFQRGFFVGDNATLPLRFRQYRLRATRALLQCDDLCGESQEHVARLEIAEMKRTHGTLEIVACDGRLVGVPQRQEYPGLRPEELGLVLRGQALHDAASPKRRAISPSSRQPLVGVVCESFAGRVQPSEPDVSVAATRALTGWVPARGACQ